MNNNLERSQVCVEFGMARHFCSQISKKTTHQHNATYHSRHPKQPFLHPNPKGTPVSSDQTIYPGYYH